MGVRDYCCFVHKNGQNLAYINPLTYKLSKSEMGKTKCFVVKIPVEIKKDNILSMKLTDFEQYPMVECSYSWDDWDFNEIDGYRDYLLNENDSDSDAIHENNESVDNSGNNDENNESVDNSGNNDEIDENNGNNSVWRNKKDGEWYVNFDPFAYNLFVTKCLDPLLVPIEYYDIIFSNNSKKMECMFPDLDKKRIFKYIADNNWRIKPNVEYIIPYIIKFSKNKYRLVVRTKNNEVESIKLTPNGTVIINPEIYDIDLSYKSDDFEIMTCEFEIVNLTRTMVRSGVVYKDSYLSHPKYKSCNFYGFDNFDSSNYTSQYDINYEHKNDYYENKHITTHKAYMIKCS